MALTEANVNVTNHAVVRYLERELKLKFGKRSERNDRDLLRDAAREQQIDVEAIRREIERIFESSRMAGVANWAKGAAFRVIVGPKVYCCRGHTVMTFYIRMFRKRGRG